MRDQAGAQAGVVTGSPAPNVVVVAIAKNEGRFLLEWIAYHRLIGASAVLVYTNDCEDGSPELLDRMQQLGLALHEPNPARHGESPQRSAVLRASAHPCVTGSDYVLRIDLDEFLWVKAGAGHIRDLIATAPGADVICVQMRFFGDSGLLRLGDGLVIEQLTRASREDHGLNVMLKSLARNNGRLGRITTGHMADFRSGLAPRIFNSAGQEIPADAYGGERFRRMPEGFRSFRFAQLNHYCVRTFADFCAKRDRGDATGAHEKLDVTYWRSRNRNEQVDTGIVGHAAGVQALIGEWLQDPQLAACNRACFDAYARIRRRAEETCQPR